MRDSNITILEEISNTLFVKKWGFGCNLKKMDHYSYWKVGGMPLIFYQISTIKGLIYTIDKLKNSDIPYDIVGNMTNILFSSNNIYKVIISFSGSGESIKYETENIINVPAHVSCPWLSYKVAKNKLSGIEHIIGIPGTLGGLIYMNGGSNRKNISENILTIDCLNSQGKLITLTREECDFSYRSSIFQNNSHIILSARILLKKENHDIWYVCKNILKERRKKFPLEYPNCGSVFKNTHENYTKFGAPGAIIEKLGLKNFSIGDASVSSKHANFIINKNSATSENIINLINYIINKASEVLNVNLESEVLYYDGEYNFIPLSKYIKEKRNAKLYKKHI